MIAYAIYAVCLAVILINVALIWFSYTAKSWSTTKGNVTTCELKRNTYPTKQPSSMGPIVRSAYLIMIRYSYSVNSKTHNSSRINFNLIDREYPDEDSANSVINELVTDRTVTVFYNRYLPWVSAIKTDKAEPGMNIMVICLTIALMIGLYWMTRL